MDAAQRALGGAGQPTGQIPVVTKPAAEQAVAISPFKSPDDVLADEYTRRKPGTLSGFIYMADGRPFRLKGARLSVEIIGISRNGNSTAENLAIEIDDKGHYETLLVGGHWRVIGKVSVPFNGGLQNAGFLDMLDNHDLAEFTDKGIVKDFAFRPCGLRAGGDAKNADDYLGRAVELNVQKDAVKTPGIVRVTLTRAGRSSTEPPFPRLS